MSRAPARRAGTLLGLAVRALAVVVVLAGCLSDAPTPAPSHAPTFAPVATAEVASYPLATTVWYGGLVLTIDGAVSSLDANGGSVSVELSLANPGPEELTLGGPLRLVAGGLAVEPSRETPLPSVPAGGTERTTLVFAVDGEFDVPSAVIVVGRAEEHQAMIPLTPGDAPGETWTVTLEPATFALEGAAQVRDLLVTLRAAELRSDLPDWGLQLPRSTASLAVTYDVAFRSDFQGGFPFTSENIALVLPGGRTVSARADGHSSPALVVGPRAVVKGLVSRFEVPAPGSGAYVLMVTNGATSKEIEVVIGGG